MSIMSEPKSRSYHVTWSRYMKKTWLLTLTSCWKMLPARLITPWVSDWD